jgi:hypothetical protein
MHGSSPSQEQALATFSHAAEERCFLRSQQWLLTYDVLIAYAALTVAPAWVEHGSLRSWTAGPPWCWCALDTSLIKESCRLRAARNCPR